MNENWKMENPMWLFCIDYLCLSGSAGLLWLNHHISETVLCIYFKIGIVIEGDDFWYCIGLCTYICRFIYINELFAYKLENFIIIYLTDMWTSNIPYYFGEVVFLKIWDQYRLPSDWVQQKFLAHLPCPSSNLVHTSLESTLIRFSTKTKLQIKLQIFFLSHISLILDLHYYQEASLLLLVYLLVCNLTTPQAAVSEISR